jgi:hypothetical protein
MVCLLISFSPDLLSALCPLQVFGETPMADVEMIFPEKVVGIKPFQLVNLAVTVFTALMTGALVLWKVRGSWCLLHPGALDSVLRNCKWQKQAVCCRHQLLCACWDCSSCCNHCELRGAFGHSRRRWSHHS